MPKDPYVVLDLPGDATAEQIREQYRLLVHAWHPDKFRTPKQRLKAELAGYMNLGKW